MPLIFAPALKFVRHSKSDRRLDEVEDTDDARFGTVLRVTLLGRLVSLLFRLVRCLVDMLVRCLVDMSSFLEYYKFSMTEPSV